MVPGHHQQGCIISVVSLGIVIDSAYGATLDDPLRGRYGCTPLIRAGSSHFLAALPAILGVERATFNRKVVLESFARSMTLGAWHHYVSGSFNRFCSAIFCLDSRWNV